MRSLLLVAFLPGLYAFCTTQAVGNSTQQVLEPLSIPCGGQRSAFWFTWSVGTDDSLFLGTSPATIKIQATASDTDEPVLFGVADCTNTNCDLDVELASLDSLAAPCEEGSCLEVTDTAGTSTSSRSMVVIVEHPEDCLSVTITAQIEGGTCTSPLSAWTNSSWVENKPTVNSVCSRDDVASFPSQTVCLGPGERVAVLYTWQLPPFDGAWIDEATATISMAARSQSNFNLFVSATEATTGCASLPLLVEDVTGFPGRLNEPECSANLQDALCVGRTSSGRSLETFQSVLTVWNTATTGDCFGVTLEGSLESAQGTPVCLRQEIVCEATSMPTSGPTGTASVSPSQSPTLLASSTPTAEPTPLKNACMTSEDPRGGSTIYSYTPFLIPCPAVGQPFAASLVWRYAQGGRRFQDSVATQLSLAASHDGPDRAGIQVAQVSNCFEADCPLPATFEDAFFKGSVNNFNCRGGLVDPNKHCSGVSQNGQSGSSDMAVIMVWNTGTCEGNVLLEANLQDFGDSLDLQDPSFCIGQMEAMNMANTDSPPPPLSDTICTTSSERQFGEDGIVSTFPSLTLPCPAEGNSTVVYMQYVLPRSPGRFLPNAASQVSVAVFHDGDDPTDGISMARETQFSDCLELPTTVEDAFSSARTENGLCSVELDSEDKLCDGVSVNDKSGTTKQHAVVIWNDGGCEGNLTVEATIRDLSQDENTDWRSSRCFLALTEVCGGDETMMPTPRPTEVPTSMPTMMESQAPTLLPETMVPTNETTMINATDEPSMGPLPDEGNENAAPDMNVTTTEPVATADDDTVSDDEVGDDAASGDDDVSNEEETPAPTVSDPGAISPPERGIDGAGGTSGSSVISVVMTVIVAFTSAWFV